MSSYLETLFSLRGKITLVTGASRGIGAALANALTAAGAQAVGVARSAEPTELASDVDYRQCDVRDNDRFESVCASVFETYGRIDVLVNAAAITLPGESDGSSVFEKFDRTISTNLVAVHHCCQAARDYMRRTGSGSIMNITSINSVVGFPDNPSYVASKGGLRMLSKALAIDFAPDRIRVNNLAPGYIRSGMTEQCYLDPICHGSRIERMSVKRWGTKDDLVGAAIFLASDASAYVTGIDLFVDGGWTARGL